MDDFDFGGFLSSRCKSLSFLQIGYAVFKSNAVRILTTETLFSMSQKKMKR